MHIWENNQQQGVILIADCFLGTALSEVFYSSCTTAVCQLFFFLLSILCCPVWMSLGSCVVTDFCSWPTGVELDVFPCCSTHLLKAFCLSWMYRVVIYGTVALMYWMIFFAACRVKFRDQKHLKMFMQTSLSSHNNQSELLRSNSDV